MYININIYIYIYIYIYICMFTFTFIGLDYLATYIMNNSVITTIKHFNFSFNSMNKIYVHAMHIII